MWTFGSRNLQGVEKKRQISFAEDVLHEGKPCVIHARKKQLTFKIGDGEEVVGPVRGLL